MRSQLQHAHRVWREAAALDAPSALMHLLTDAERCYKGLLEASSERIARLLMPYPLDAVGHFAVRRNTVLSAFELARDMLDLGTVAAAVDAIAAGQQGLQTGRAHLGVGVAAALALDTLDLATSAVHYMQLGLKNGLLDHLPACESRGQRPASAQPSTAQPSSRQQVSEVLNALLLQLCSEKALSAAAGLLSALTPGREQRRRAGAASLEINWDRRRFFTGVGALVEGLAMTLPSTRGATSLPNLLRTTMMYVYGTVHGVFNKATGPACEECDDLVNALISGLEKSKVLEVSASTLMIMPPPAAGQEASVDMLMLTRVTAELSCTSILLSSLALLVMGGGLLAGSASRAPGAQPWVNSTMRPSLYGKLCGLLLQPSLVSFQRALLDRFCLNGGVPRRDGEAAGSSAAAAAGGSGSGWELMDKLRIDAELCDMYEAFEGSRAGTPDPTGISDRVTAIMHTMMVLTTPALEFWNALSTSPAMHKHLPSDLDETLSRVLEAALRMADGKGDADSPFGQGMNIRLITSVVMKSWMVSAGVWQRWTLPMQPEPAEKLQLTHATLEVLAWQLAAQSRLAPLLRETTLGSSTAAARVELPLATAHWLRFLTEAMHYWSRPEVTEAWCSFKSKTKQDVVRRLARADLLSSLDRGLRICANYGGTALLLECGIKPVEGITLELMFPILEEQLRALEKPTGGSGPTNDDVLRIDLGLLVTVAKLVVRSARELDAETATAAAAGGIFSRYGSISLQHPALQGLMRRWYGTFSLFNVLAYFCSWVGPMGHQPGVAQKLGRRPEVAAVSELCVRAAVIAGRAFLASHAAKQRLTAPLRNRDSGAAGGRSSEAAGRGCLFRDITGGSRPRVCRALQYGPACLTAVLADPGVGAPGSIPPLAELLAALQPEQLLADCASLTLDWADACVEVAGRAGARGGGQRSGGLTGAPSAQDEMLGSQDVEDVGRAANQCWIAVVTLAARGDTAPYMYKWLGGGGGAAAAPEAARPPPPRLRGALEQLMAGAPVWLLSVDMRSTIKKLLAAVPSGDDAGGGNGAAVEAMRQVAKAGLIEYQADLLATAAMDPVDIAAIRRVSPWFTCALGMQGAGMEPAVDACGVRLVPPSPLRQEGPSDGIPLVKVCGNPGCESFEGPSEAALGLKRCGRCLKVRYCSTACQQQHWKEHKKTCGGAASRG